MSVWRLQLKVDTGNYSFEETLNFCIKNNIIGVGWKIENKYDDYYKLRDEIYKHKDWKSGAFKGVNALRNMEINDLIWTRLGGDASKYYLCRVTKKWIDCSSVSEYEKYDLSNYVCCDWILVGTEDKVPGKVVNSLYSRSTVQHVYDVDEISKIIWNKYSDKNGFKYETSNLTREKFWNMIGSEELESLVLLYLQFEKNYMIYSSTLKKSSPKYEAIMIAKDGSHRCFPQVKRNEQLLQKNYVDNTVMDKYKDKVFLFTTSEDYGNEDLPQVECIKKTELEDFMKNNYRLLPSSIIYWLDMINFQN